MPTWTGDFVDISKFVPHHFVVVSKNLGYQGIRTKSWYFLAAFKWFVWALIPF